MVDTIETFVLGKIFFIILILIHKSQCIVNNNHGTAVTFVIPSINKLNPINSSTYNPSIISAKKRKSFNICKLISSELTKINKDEVISHKFDANNLIHAYIAGKKFQLDDSLKTILLSGIYGLRIFKCMLYLRYILEWLPQVNPYLPPFCTIFTATNNFIGFFQKICPPIMGFDFSGFAVWVFLENIEFILLHILSNY